MCSQRGSEKRTYEAAETLGFMSVPHTFIKENLHIPQRRKCIINGGMLLAKSPEHNPCGEICSHHGTRLNKNRIPVLSYSTIIHNKTCSCRLVVISPAVSQGFSDTLYRIRLINALASWAG